MAKAQQSFAFDADGPHIAQAAAAALLAIEPTVVPLSKAQQTFNRLIEQIRRQREVLQSWQEFMPRFRQRWATDMEPAMDALLAARRRLALLFDETLTLPPRVSKLSRRQRDSLTQRLLMLIDDLLQHDEDDAELVALHDRYNDFTREDMRKHDMEFTEAMLKDILGEEAVRGHQATDADDLMRHANEQMRALSEQLEAARAEQQAKREAKREAKRTAKLGAKAGSAQTKAEQAAQAAREASQSVREIFRKLASALHPDREADPVERERKTKLMQRANQAYQNNDLLELLSLQIEIEQIDSEHLTHVTDERLLHYNQVLKEQLGQLQAEVDECTAPIRAPLQFMSGSAKLTPTVAMKMLDDEVRRLRGALAGFEREMDSLRDPAVMRDFLNQG